MKHLFEHHYSLLGMMQCGTTTLASALLKPLKPAYVSVLICQQGEALLTINFEEYVVHAQDIVVLYDDTFVRVERCSPTCQFDYVLLEKEFAKDVAYPLPNSLFGHFNVAPVQHLNSSEWGALQHWQGLFDYLLQQQGDYVVAMLRLQVQNFFLMIANNMPQVTLSEKTKQSRKEQLCWRFWELVTQHCKTQRNVSFYAQKLAITPYYLSQVIREFFNDTPKALIDRQVILEIKALLSAGDKSIKEVASELNFEDTSYLSRYFKRHTGQTLIQFKKSYS